MSAPLPVDGRLDDLAAALAREGIAVLKAPTGAGKTTRVPPALLDAGLAGERQLVVLQPRRLAARAAARRIASERGTPLGEEVGYHVRFDRRAGPATRLVVATEGILVRRLQRDPLLEDVGLVVFDEFHERRLDADLALALVRRVQSEVRPDLKVLVMSATLDAPQVADRLGGCPALTCEGRLHPVEVRHLPRRLERPLEDLVSLGLSSVLAETAGDVLVFLPGVGEIHRCRSALGGLAARHDAELVPLYGDLPAQEQDAALRGGARRRVILATNVAETSVTVEGVTGVVDSGLVRALRFDPSVGLDRLALEPASRASAEQRAGRAGRLAPGLCARLWTADEHRMRPPDTTPEVRRLDLSGAVLQLAAWGERDPRDVPWFEPPPEAALLRAAELLRALDAVDEAGAATALGRRMAGLPVHPRLARLLLAGADAGVGERAALAAALLSERDPFRRSAPGPAASCRSDVLERLVALERGGQGAGIDRGASHHVLRTARQLARLAGPSRGAPRRDGPAARGVGPGRAARTSRARRGGTPGGPAQGGAGPTGGAPTAAASGNERDEPLLRALLAAYPDRVARRRARGSDRAVMVGGRGLRLGPSSGVRGPLLFVAVDVDAGRGPESLVRLASAVEAHWLETRTSVDVLFDEDRGAVVARRRVRHRDLVLEETPAELPSDGTVASVLAEAAGTDPLRALDLDASPVASWRARLERLRALRPDLDLPALDADGLRELLPALCRGRTSLAELRAAPLLDALRARLGWEGVRLLDELVPERLLLPSGRRARLEYGGEGPPVLAVRMQELFGLRETPRVGGGRVPVVLHLLAPNGRPEQITDDLAGFWERTWPRVRRELSRRYPKHAWPEDPLAARAESGPRRRPPT